MANDRNKLTAGMAGLLGRSSGPSSRGDVELSRKSGRPVKGTTGAWNSARDCRTTLVFDVEQYNKIRRLSNSTGQTVKQLMFLLLEEGLKRYESGDLKIRDLTKEPL